MTICPKCNGRLSFLKVISLRPKKNIIKCQKCNSNLVAILGRAFAKLTTTGFIGIGSFKFASYLLKIDSEWSTIAGVFGFFCFFVGIYLFVKGIALVVYSGKEESIKDIQMEIDGVECSADFNKEKARFKELYIKKSEKELKLIATEKGWQLPAKEAAKEILRDREKS
jgi:hypothetical protein